MNCLEFSSYVMLMKMLPIVVVTAVVMLFVKTLVVEEGLVYDVVESSKAFSFFKKFFQCKY